MKIIFTLIPKHYFILLFSFLFANTILFGQTDNRNNRILERLNEIDHKMIQGETIEAISLLKKLEEIKGNSTIQDKYAIELRRFHVEYYINNNDENFNVALKRLDKISEMKIPLVEYDYLSFIAQVYKISFDFDNAIKYHKKALKIAEKRKDTTDIIYTCWSLGSSYYLIEYIDKPQFYKNKLDSALYFYNKALKFPENKTTIKYLPRIYNNLGRIETAKNNLSKSKVYIYKALDQHTKANDSFGIAISLNNLSKVFLVEKDYGKSIELAKKSNRYIKNKSLRVKQNNLEYIALSSYNIGQLKEAYIAMRNRKEISEKLTNITFLNNVKKTEIKYKIAKEQQNTLKEKYKRLNLQLLLYITGFSIVILVIIGFIFYTRNKQHKEKFDELIEKYKPRNNKDNIDLPIDTINNVLNGLLRFENEKLFLRKNIYLKSLAKELSTNSSYLSKIVNTHKKKNFNSYLNELRIEYAIDQLTHNKELRQYTIEGIADCMGYNNGDSFSSAFRKITGLYPSYFIKQLDKNHFDN